MLGILGILEIENRKSKIDNCKFVLSFQAGNNYQKKKEILNLNFFFFFCVRADCREEGGRGGRGGEIGRGEGRKMRPHGRVCVRADAPCFIPGNFEKDAIVRPSHGRPCGHPPTVRPSENVRMTTLILMYSSNIIMNV
jgi:hypothetical protein